MERVSWELGQHSALLHGLQTSVVRLEYKIERRLDRIEERIATVEQRPPPPAVEAWVKLVGAAVLPFLAYWLTGDRTVLVNMLGALHATLAK